MPLWENKEIAIGQMRAPISHVDVMKISDEETELLTGQVDTTGAGDSFWGGFVYQLLSTGKEIDQLTIEELKKCVRFVNAVAGICVIRRGAIPVMPTLEEVEEKLG